MVIAGITNLVLPLLHLGPNYPDFQARSFAFRIGAKTRELAFSAVSVVAGVGLFWHQGWARKLALGLLLIWTFYAAEAFAWGFSNGQPTPRVRLISYVLVAAWNGLWFYLIYGLAL
jgi:hypothetical protein